MLPKRIDKAPDIHDSYAYLARYVAAAREQGEKLDRLWIVNCDAGDTLADLDLAIAEIEATRMHNTRAANRTYHLMISFRPGELERLSSDDLKDIERTFAEALGFGEHQRIAATHINTDHPHLHVAISTIHPRSLRAHTPRRDFLTLARVAREMEQKYGLSVDRGMTDDHGRHPASVAARDFEARTWQQSFQSYVLEHQADILAGLAAAATWPEAHQVLDGFGIEIRRRGAGLVLVEQDGKQAMKASALDRACALKALEDRLGPFQPRPPDLPPRKAGARRRRYKARPLTLHPATVQLWRRYLGLRRGGLHPVGPPGPLAQAMNRGLLQSWKDFLLEDAHRDGLAMAVILAYRQMFAPPGRTPRRVPKLLKPALSAQFAAAPWAERADLPWAWSPQAAVGLKVDEHGRLLIPFRDAAGSIQGLRAVEADGRTADLPGFSPRPGLTHVLDPGRRLAAEMPYRGTILVATGHAEAAMLQAASGAPVVLAARPRDLAPAVNALRRRHPEASVVVLSADRLEAALGAASAEAAASLRHAFARAAEPASPPPPAVSPAPAAPPPYRLLDPEGAIGRGPLLLTTDPASAPALQAALGLPVAVADPAAAAQVAAHLVARYPGQPLHLAAEPAVLATAAPAATVSGGKALALAPLLRAARQAGEDHLRTTLAPLVGDTAWRLWASAEGPPTPGTAPWLAAKGIRGHGLRARPDGSLLVPLTDPGGRLRDVLALAADGTAAPVAPDPAGPPLWFRLDPLGRLSGDGPVVIAGDYAAAAIIQRETRLPVVLVPDPAHRPAIAGQVRADHPARLVIVATDHAPDPAEQLAAAGAAVALVAPPDGARFADLGRDRSEQVRAAFADAADDLVMLRWQDGRAARPGEAAPLPDDTPATVRLDGAGNRLLALRDPRGRLVGVQTLAPSGETLDSLREPAAEAPHALVANAFALKTGSIVLTDDLAAAGRLGRETAHAVVYYPPGSDPAEVATLLRRRHPQARVALLAAAEASPLGDTLPVLPLAEALRPQPLAVPYGARQAARAAGARWDPEARVWVAPAGSDPEAFTAWLPDQAPERGR